MPNPNSIVSNLSHHCQLTSEPQDALTKCCQILLEPYAFDVVFLAFSQSVQDPLESLACAGKDELMEKSFYRLGIEDRLSLLKTSSKVLGDITGKPTFSTSGTLRIQKPSSGVFAALELSDKRYLVLGCVHQDVRKYEDTMPEDLATIWNGWRTVLTPVAEKLIAKKSEPPPPKKPEHPVEDAVKLDNLQIAVPTHKPGDTASSSTNFLQRPLQMVDEGTRLYNRHFFSESLSIEVERARRHQRNISLILLSLTALKPIHGEEDWNRLAIQVAEILVKALRRVDIICRYDRNKFALVLPDTPNQNLSIIAKRIFKFFRQAMGEDPMAFLNLSTAAYPKHADNEALLLQKAEERLNQAVAAGPNKAILSE